MAASASDIARVEADLTEVRAAITAIVTRGQKAEAHGRVLTRADLTALEDRETHLEKKLARMQRGGIRMRQAVPK